MSASRELAGNPSESPLQGKSGESESRATGAGGEGGDRGREEGG